MRPTIWIALMALASLTPAVAAPPTSDLLITLKAPSSADASQPIALTIERRNTGKRPRVVFIREGCPGETLDTIFDGDKPLPVTWMGMCDDNYWVRKRLAPGEATSVEYSVRLARGTHRLRATYVVDAKRLKYGRPDEETWLGRAESQLATVDVR